MKNRVERDKFGEKLIPEDVYWGIHTQRAIENFQISNLPNQIEIIKALIMVKKACAITNQRLEYLDNRIADSIIEACNRLLIEDFSDNFIIDSLQGGAGTSTNMNVNEVICNIALEILGEDKGNYNIINPIEHVNLFQSTNDTYPTAVKIAIIYKLRELSDSIAKLQGSLQSKETEFSRILTIGRTELQDAVPITLGSQFASFAEAISRDRWRTFKSEERIRIVNIGGTAVGTGLTAPKKYIFQVIEELRVITDLGLSRADQVMDATANCDVFVEVAGMLNSNTVNLIKIAKDLRLLHYFGEIHLPELQAGSSIMPGKVNPVLLESVITTCIKVKNELRNVEDLSSMGTLQINEYLPAIADSILTSIKLLINIQNNFSKHISSITADSENCQKMFDNNKMIITAFLPAIGYNKCEDLLYKFTSEEKKISFREFLSNELGKDLVDKTLSVQNLMSLGYK